MRALRLWNAAAGALCGLLLASCDRAPASGGQPEVAARRPNVLVLLIDAFRADRVSAYGHPEKLTPTIDEIAAEGVLLEQAFAVAPWTLPSVASLFTSYYPSVHGATDYRAASMAARTGGVSVAVLHDHFETLAEVLQREGYATAAVSANVFVQPQFGFGQGFDAFRSDFVANHVPGTLVNEAALAWLDGRPADRPFFLYLHYMDVHGPYDAEPRFMKPRIEAVANKPDKRALTRQEFENINQYLRAFPQDAPDLDLHKRLSLYWDYWVARYEAGVAQMDYHLHLLRQALRERGLWDDTLLILTADHGEAFCEHKDRGFERLGWWDHGYSQYQTQLHVPLILRWPGELAAGARMRGNVELIDLYPTMLELLGIRAVEGLQGGSFAAGLRGGSLAPAQAFAETIKLQRPQIFAYVDGDWKLIRTEVSGRPIATNLFNLAVDPGEQNDWAAREPARVEALLEGLERQRALNRQIKPALASGRAPAPSSLAGLGYVAQPLEDEHEHEHEDGAASAPGSRPASDTQPAQTDAP